MRVHSLVIAIIFLSAGASVGGEQSTIVAQLEPGLQQALLHDAACRTAPQSGTEFLQVPVRTEEIGAGGHESGVIASPQDACHCKDGNCSTYVYLRTDEGYRLAFKNRFASLHPMKIVKHGLPSLSGKLQVNDGREETTVYDWDGKEYKPSLCATVTQPKNRRLPVISQHPCVKAQTPGH